MKKLPQPLFGKEGGKIVVGIIGGTGAMGKYFANIFKTAGFEVLVSGSKTSLTNAELAQQSDLLIFSVPISKTVEIVNSVAQHISPSTILFDLTSIKQPVLNAMLATKAQEVIGGHPMFSPTVPIKGQTVILSPGRGEQGQIWLQQFFEKQGAIVKIINAQKHDKLMAVIQGLNHFSNIVFAKALAEIDIEINDLLDLQSPIYRLQMDLMGRILAQKHELYGDIMMHNPANKAVVEHFTKAAEELDKIVLASDQKQFLSYCQTAAEHLGDFKEEALQESDQIIKQIYTAAIENKTKSI